MMNRTTLILLHFALRLHQLFFDQLGMNSQASVLGCLLHQPRWNEGISGHSKATLAGSWTTSYLARMVSYLNGFSFTSPVFFPLCMAKNRACSHSGFGAGCGWGGCGEAGAESGCVTIMQVVHGLQQFTMIDHEPFTAALLSKLAHTARHVYPAISPDLCVLTFSFFFFSLFMGLQTFFFFFFIK